MEAVANAGELSALPNREVKLRVRLYANDAVVFANPAMEEIELLLVILEDFEEATGLRVNLNKSLVAPICCRDIDLDDVLHSFGGERVNFPLRYLGLPITLTRTRLVHIQFILNHIRARLAGWKAKMLTTVGRRVLVRAVLSAMLTFALIVLRAPKIFFEGGRQGSPVISLGTRQGYLRGSCKVNWKKVCSPMDLGGLGIQDFYKFIGLALALV